jgi:acetyl esterase/lipase
MPIVSLDPHVKRFLDMAAIAGVPEISKLTPSLMRQAYLQLAQMVGAKGVPIGRVMDSELPGPGGPLAIRIYTPVSPTAEQLPGLIYFHGGGWVFGGLDTHDGVCRMLANSAGCRVIAVAYRLAPEHAFPAAVEDSYAATNWVVQHASELDIDHRRIAIGGDSAGGTLAAVVCQRAEKMGGPNLALQVLLCPVMDMSTETQSRRAFAAGYFLDKATIDWTLMHYCSSDVDLKDPRISPLHGADLRGLPPMHIHTAEFDPLRDEGKAYADRLERAGVNVSYTCHDGMIHNFYAMAGVIPYARTAMASAGAAIKMALT